MEEKEVKDKPDIDKNPNRDEEVTALVLTEQIEGESQASQAETLKEAQCAEHGDVHREGDAQTKHQHEKQGENQGGVSTKPTAERNKHTGEKKMQQTCLCRKDGVYKRGGGRGRGASEDQ